MHRTPLAAASLLLAATAAQAGLHSICYEGPTRVKFGSNGSTSVVEETLTMVAGCIDDSGGTCTITPIGADVSGPTTPLPMGYDAERWQAEQRVEAQGTFEYFQYTQSRRYSPLAQRLRALITFVASGQTHECEVTPRGYVAPPPIVNGSYPYTGHAVGTLTGFSTDASGLVSTGVWRNVSSDATLWARVPGDFVVVGGGAAASDGAFVERSRFGMDDDPVRTWQATTWSTNATQLSQPTGPTAAYAIGMRVRGLPANLEPLVPDAQRKLQGADLRAFVGRAEGAQSQVLPGQPLAAWRLDLPSAKDVALGGDIDARGAIVPGRNTSGHGVFALRSEPNNVFAWLRCALVNSVCPPSRTTGWQVEAVAELGYHMGDISLRMSHLPAQLVVGGKAWEVRTRTVSASSAMGRGGKAEAGGLRGEYAVAGAGAAVNWRPQVHLHTDINTWLTRIEPRMDIGGARAESRTGTSPAGSTSLTAYATGVKLVPAGTPDDKPVARPERLSRAWLCSAVPELRESSLCGEGDDALKTAEICRMHPDLADHGLCRKP